MTWSRQHPADLTGHTYAGIVVLGYSHAVRGTSGKSHYWLCWCGPCGREFTRRRQNLLDGRCISCGCLGKPKGRPSPNRLARGEASFRCLLGGYKRSAAARGYAFEISDEEFRELTHQACHYCGSPPSQIYNSTHKSTHGPYTYTGVDRVDNTAGYHASNVRACCKQCNIAKGTLGELEFYAWARRLAERLP